MCSFSLEEGGRAHIKPGTPFGGRAARRQEVGRLVEMNGISWNENVKPRKYKTGLLRAVLSLLLRSWALYPSPKSIDSNNMRAGLSSG